MTTTFDSIQKIMADDGFTENTAERLAEQILAVLPVLPEHDCADLDVSQQLRLEAAQMLLQHIGYNQDEVTGRLIRDVLALAKAIETGQEGE